MPVTLCVVLARGGSKGILRKNVQKLHGKPLVAYSIEAALQSNDSDITVLSTDNDEIADVAKKFDMEVIWRQEGHADDTAPIELALRDVVKKIEKRYEKIDYVIALYGCVVILNKGIIDKVINKMMTSGADSVETYSPFRFPPQLAYTIKDDIPCLLENKYEFVYRRQQLETTYFPDGAVLAVRRDILMQDQKESSNAHSWLGVDRRALFLSYDEVVNVDEPIDLLWGEFLVGHHNAQKQKV